MIAHPAGPRHAEEVHHAGAPDRPRTAAEVLTLFPNVWPHNTVRGDDGVVSIAGVAVTAAALSMGALGLAGMAYAQPAPPAEPGVPPPPGQPVFQPVAGGDAPPVAPPPVGPPMVPEIQNPGYGQNSSGGGGTLAFLREAWNMAQDPYGFTQIPPEGLPTSAPPPGAGRHHRCRPAISRSTRLVRRPRCPRRTRVPSHLRFLPGTTRSTARHRRDTSIRRRRTR